MPHSTAAGAPVMGECSVSSSQLAFEHGQHQESCMNLIRRIALGCTFVGAAFSIPLTANAVQSCSIPNAAGTAVSYTCAVTYTPTTPNWLTSFKTWMAANQTSGAMACFGPGTYVLPSTLVTADRNTDANRMVLRNVQNMKLCAPTGGAIFEHKSVNAAGTPLTAEVAFPSFHIATSSGVSIKGMEFRNKTDYAVGTTAQQVTWTVLAETSSDTRFFNSKMSGLGKGVVTAMDSSVTLSGSTLSCAYFCAAGDRKNGPSKPTFKISNSQFTINHTKDATDEHAAVWLHNTDFDISDSTFNFVTGQGFVAGQGTPADWVNLNNVTISGTTPQGRLKMFGWIAISPNYWNLQINYTGAQPYTQFGRAYYCIGFQNAPCESGYESAGNTGSLFKYRANATSSFVTAALPPAKTKKILFLNAGGQDSVWAQTVIVQNRPSLSTPVLQQWSTVGTALTGWLDAGDTVLTGDFLVAGQQRVLNFNTQTQDGAIFVRALGGTGSGGTMTGEASINWTPALASSLAGWHDANDKLLAGDFTGLGRSQLLFMNVDGAGGAFFMAAVDGANSQLQTLAIIPWSASLSTSLAGWMDATDKLVAGDFTGTGRSQLLFLNTDGGTQGAASLRQYDAASNSFQIVNTVPWNKLVGNTALWTTASTKTLTGDFLGLNKDQLMFINPTGTGTAISIWAFDSATGVFSEIHKMNWSTSEIAPSNLAGFLDSNDWQLGF
jgi:hypothetical protein